MIFHLVLNSLLIFLTLTGIVEGILFVFKINQSRIRYLCRLIPIVKMPFDFFVFLVYGESFLINFNPFSCEMETQALFINLIPYSIQSELSAGGHLIIPAYLAAFIPQPFLNIFMWVVAGISLIFLGRKIVLFIQGRLVLNHILRFAQPYTKAIQNQNLLTKLRQINALILISQDVHIPFAAYSHLIVFPKDLLNELSQEEFEAVIVHELEHLRWKDPFLKLLVGFICSLFWWIPSNWWLARLEIEQEQACDGRVPQYGIEGYSLATALLKVAKRAKYLQCRFSAICPFDSPKSSHVQRLKNILDCDQPLSLKLSYFNYTLGLALCALSFVSFWMC